MNIHPDSPATPPQASQDIAARRILERYRTASHIGTGELAVIIVEALAANAIRPTLPERDDPRLPDILPPRSGPVTPPQPNGATMDPHIVRGAE